MRPIDADALLKSIDKDSEGKPGQYGDEWQFIRTIENAPTIDAVSVVRCKECKYYEKFPSWSTCTYWSGDPYEQASVNDDDFCSYGERKG